MNRTPVDILNMLERVSWSSFSISSKILSDNGYQNQFCGTNDYSYKTLAPHHVKQVHGTKVIASSSRTEQNAIDRPDGDAIYTTSNHAVAVKTADCLPILLASRETKFAMAVHAGWRGFTSGIINQALKVSDQFAQRSSLIVCIGPAISHEAFEVGRDVIDQVASGADALPQTIWPFAVGKGKTDRWHLDLQLAAILQLLVFGINPEAIDVIRSCTRTQRVDIENQSESRNPYAWHSYRREGNLCGSNWSWIKSA